VSKAIDKQKGNQSEVYEMTAWIRSARDAAGITNKDVDAAFGTNGMAGHWTSSTSQPAVPTLEQFPKLLDVLGVEEMPEDIQALALRLIQAKGQPGPNWFKREVVGTKMSGIANAAEGPRHTIGASKAVEVNITTPSTPEAQQWEGWGTALKPAHEPIVVARKPLIGTVAANVLEHGTGALNIDASRVGRVEGDASTGGCGNGGIGIGSTGDSKGEGKGAKWVTSTEGRWPANIIFDEDAGAELDAQSGTRQGGAFPKKSNVPTGKHYEGGWGVVNNGTRTEMGGGGASRFFYCAKASKSERNAGLEGLEEKEIGVKGNGLARTCGTCSASVLDGCDCPDRTFNNPKRQNFHPTVKPLALMRYLVKLVTPPSGIVLDPFLGSGTTAVAAILEGFKWVGCEMTDEYLPIIEARVAWAGKERERETATPELW